MRKSRLGIAVIIALMAIGFAAVSATLFINGKVKYGANLNDWDVYFSEALLDGEISEKAIISANKKTIHLQQMI